ncbi:hypothetical protein [Photobacterium sp. OFAV2-7]|uniref:phosphotransferase-like protein n=1 Tax=Photobacterium sp. OFAV2-7 TaxID=2917748 RepID=UPI00351D3A1A
MEIPVYSALFLRENLNMDVIILNGASSSAKSSIAKQLQSLLDEYYPHIGIDTFISMMPQRCNELSQANQISDGFYWEPVI